MRAPFAAVAAVAVLCSTLVAVAGCSGAGSTVDGLTVTGAFGRQPTVAIPKKTPGSGLAVGTTVSGKGTTIGNGDLVVAQYVGYRWSGTTSRLVADSYTSGQPGTFPYGQLVSGLNTALSGKKVGSRVVAVIPPSDGYGTSGDTQMQISGSDSIVLVLDLLAAYPKTATAHGRSAPPGTYAGARMPTVANAVAGQAPAITIPARKAPSALTVETLVHGSGATVRSDDLVVFQEKGELWRDGQVIASTWQGGRPDSVVVGEHQMITGWERAVLGQTVGSQVLAVVPPSQGYGKAGHPASHIKSTDTLVFVIDIIAVYGSG
jgi:peptidylprolyl isomerase